MSKQSKPMGGDRDKAKNKKKSSKGNQNRANQLEPVSTKMTTSAPIGSDYYNASKKLQPSNRELKKSISSAQTTKSEPMGQVDELAKGNKKLNRWIEKDIQIERREFPKLPKQTEMRTPDQQKLFELKCKLCRLKYDWSRDTDYQSESKKLKLSTLNEIRRLIMENPRINIFRELPKLPKHTDPRGWNPVEDVAPRDLTWLHLESVYDILLQLLHAKDIQPELANKFVNKQFALTLMRNFNSPDIEERAAVKICLHRIYAFFSRLRPAIMIRMQNVCLWYTSVEETFLGVNEMLEVLCSITSGYKPPLEKPHKNLLLKILLPMHRCENFVTFHQPFFFCMSQFVEKEPELAEDVLLTLIRYWPYCNYKKEVVFFREFQDILQLTAPSVFEKIYRRIHRHLSLCTISSNNQVSMHALEMWNLDYFVALVVLHPHEIMELYLPYILECAGNHWSKDNRDTARSLLELVRKLDPELFARLLIKTKEDRMQRHMHEKRIARTLKHLASKKHKKSIDGRRKDRKSYGRSASRSDNPKSIPRSTQPPSPSPKSILQKSIYPKTEKTTKTDKPRSTK